MHVKAFLGLFAAAGLALAALPVAAMAQGAATDAASPAAAARQEREAPWLAARDAAMIELLYSSGLRSAELIGLDVAASPQAAGWIDLQAAEAHVLGKGHKRRSTPLGRAAAQALQACGLEVKTAVVALRLGLAPEPARERLATLGGSLRRALQEAS